MILGGQIRAGRVLALLEQAELAAAANISETTLRALEKAGHSPVPGYAETLQKVLANHGVAMTSGGVMLIRRAESAQGATRAAAMAIDFE